MLFLGRNFQYLSYILNSSNECEKKTIKSQAMRIFHIKNWCKEILVNDSLFLAAFLLFIS